MLESSQKPQIALFEPDIPQNMGTILRLSACLDMIVHIIEPCGFPFSIKAVRRSLMDYEQHVQMVSHKSWDDFNAWCEEKCKNVILVTTKAAIAYTDYEFKTDDILLFGSESSGAPDYVHAAAKERIIIPMKKNLRSINVATATAMIVGEALRQTDGF